MKFCRPHFFRHTYNMWLRGGPGKAPGIQKRLDLIREDTPDLSRLKIDEKVFDDLEADLNNSEALADHHISDLNRIRKKIEFNQIERKYFGVNKKPNMLTWSEKEQIRHLNHIDPEIWTPEKLADSFPATIDVIKKLIRSQWIPRDLKRVKKHDKAVSANWKAFETGRLNLPENLKEHFSKFTSRRKIVLANETPESLELTETASCSDEEGEWSRIVAKCQNESTSKRENHPLTLSPSGKSETYVLGGHKRGRHTELMTLAEVKKTQSLSDTDDRAPFDRAFIMHCIESRLVAKERHSAIINSNYVPSLKMSQSSSGTFSSEKLKEEKIQMTINIPKNKWKKGAIYRVNNCYYSDEGKFLYKAVFGRKT
ncbi:uncharacterized protein LOC106668721 isoform X2 [Cimex lectularius]|uniref:Neurite outgrowth-associated protein n=1 Tax=Cimex lectularius TaxID=79782 RepID=A0A8I6RXD1_CIMLE|nr:uncharacterized protein LOC106668721 isoform X2 [Cimex lectularius]